MRRGDTPRDDARRLTPAVQRFTESHLPVRRAPTRAVKREEIKDDHRVAGGASKVSGHNEWTVDSVDRVWLSQTCGKRGT